MKYSFKDYTKNPMGYKNMVFTQKHIYFKIYKDKFRIVNLREGGKIKYQTYKDKSNYFIHYKIPSEVVPKLYYDVIIQFIPGGMFKKKTKFDDYDVKFFSNDPAFVYTFAHAMIKNRLFINDLIPKMSQEAIKKVAKTRNPKSQIGYVKSLMFAYLHMQDNNLFDLEKFEENVKPYSKEALLSKVTHSDTKIKERQHFNTRSNLSERRSEIQRERDQVLATKREADTPKSTKAINKVKNTKVNKSSIKKTKKVK